MAFLSVNKDIDDESAGILYILVFRLDDGTEVYKIGVTKRKIQERVVEILASFWISFRYFPYCYPKRFKKTSDVYKKETEMHQLLDEFRFEFDKRFDGSTEFFSGVELDEILDKYEKCLKGKLDEKNSTDV